MKHFHQIALLLLILKKLKIKFLCGVEMPGFREKWEKWGLECKKPILYILDPNYPSFYLKCPRKCQEICNFEIFPALS